MILIEKHHIKPSNNNWLHCDFLSYVNKNLYNSSLYYIKQQFIKQLKFKKDSIGLASASGLDFKNYLKQNPYIISKRHYLDKDNNPKITNQYAFEFIHLNKQFINSTEYNTKTHTDYINIQQNYFNTLQDKINDYSNLTKQDYWSLRNKSGKFNVKKTPKNNKLKHKNFNYWKKQQINSLKQQLIIPININTKILKQTQRQVNQDFSNYFSSLITYYSNPDKFKALPQAPNYKTTGNKGRTVATVPKEAISYISYRKVINNEQITAKVNNHYAKYSKQSELGVSKIRNKDKYFITIANMNIMIESAICKEQIKEIKIIPLNNPKVNDYNILVIYDNSICNNKEDNKNLKDKDLIHNKIIKLIKEIQELNSSVNKTNNNINNNKENKLQLQLINKQQELTSIIQEHKIDIASIDMGVNNLMTIATTNPDITPVIINGHAVKSINQFYNKILSKNKSQLSKIGLFTSRKLNILTNKRNQQIENALHVASRKVINFLLSNNINYLVIGKNIGWKEEINIGSNNNQTFVQIPHAKLIEKLKYKCEKEGIMIIMQEEAYTSKASFIDMDNIPMYKKGLSKELKCSGKRICRGLYKSLKGILINADLNGALNILRKVIGNELFINGSNNSLNSIEDWAVNPLKINI